MYTHTYICHTHLYIYMSHIYVCVFVCYKVQYMFSKYLAIPLMYYQKVSGSVDTYEISQ